jgi:ferredoxin
VTVHVERDACIGSGMCALTVPAVFDQDPVEAVVVLLDPDPPADLLADVKLAVQRCPAAVISIR